MFSGLQAAGGLAAAVGAQQASGIAGATVDLEDLAVVREFGAQIVLVAVRVTTPENTWELYGVARVHDDLAAAAALAGGEGARSYRDRWREQLNRNVARKLGRLGG